MYNTMCHQLCRGATRPQEPSSLSATNEFGKRQQSKLLMVMMMMMMIDDDDDDDDDDESDVVIMT